MAKVLEDREEEVKACQAEILRSGVLRTREYERRIRTIQAESYDRMAAVLSPEARRRFFEIVSEGRLGDAIAFQVPENVIVIE